MHRKCDDSSRAEAGGDGEEGGAGARAVGPPKSFAGSQMSIPSMFNVVFGPSGQLALDGHFPSFSRLFLLFFADIF